MDWINRLKSDILFISEKPNIRKQTQISTQKEDHNNQPEQKKKIKWKNRKAEKKPHTRNNLHSKQQFENSKNKIIIVAVVILTLGVTPFLK